MQPQTLLSWNVNGIRAAYKKGFLDWMKEASPDILCLQETKAQKEQLHSDLLNIEGYTSYFSSAEKKGYSGVALYTKTKPNEVKKGIGIPEFDSEGRVVHASYDNFELFNVYFPNGQASKDRLAYKMAFYDAFLAHIESIRKSGKNIVVCGDVNTAHAEIDLARPKANEKTSGFLPIERAWIDKLLSHGYVDTFRAFNTEPDNYSWWSMRTRAREKNVGWRIDYFYANEEFMGNVEDGFILPDVMGSDHCPIGITVNI